MVEREPGLANRADGWGTAWRSMTSGEIVMVN